MGNISNTKMPTKKPTSALAEIRRKRRYFVFFNGFFKFVKIYNICGGTSIKNRYISAVSKPILIKQR